MRAKGGGAAHKFKVKMPVICGGEVRRLGGGFASMLHRLQLTNFRPFSRLDLDLSGEDAVFVGANAQGKTSILEAACVLLRVASPRASAPAEMIKFEAPAYVVEGDWCDRALRHGFAPRSRRLAVDGEVQRSTSSYLAHSGRLVWMGNEDLELVRGRSDARRRYLDFIASQREPAYRPALLAYEKALRSRNRLLKLPRQDWGQIDAYGAVLAENGEVLVHVREALVAALTPHAERAQTHLSGGAEQVQLRYAPRAPRGDVAERMAAARDEDARRGMTTTGPHRDDLEIALADRPAAKFASEGQQRSLALALRLAQATLLGEDGEEAPLLLIDDVFGELDLRRRNLLLEYLPQDMQKLITTTHLDWCDEGVGFRARRFDVLGGTANLT